MKCKGIHKCKNENKSKHTQEILKKTLEDLDKQ